MAGLLDKIRVAKTEPEFDDEIPDKVPPEWLEETDPDPEPVRPEAAKKTRTPAPPRANSALKRKVKVELEAYAKMAALALSMRDPHCGGALNDQASAIADSLAELIARHPDLAAKFINAGVLGDWAKLLMAVQPVVAAFYRHHIVKSADDRQEVPGVDPGQYPAYRPGA